MTRTQYPAWWCLLGLSTAYVAGRVVWFAVRSVA
jgi:hypothetical protein